MFKSIRLKLTIYFALIFALILLGASYLLYKNAYNNRISNIDGSLSVIVTDMAGDMMDKQEILDINEINEDTSEFEEQLKIDTLHVRIIEYNFLTKKENILMKTLKTNNSIFTTWKLKKDMHARTVYYKTLQNYRTAMEFVKIDEHTIRAVQTAVLITFKDQSLKHTLFILLSVNAIIFLFSIIGVYLLISRTLLPVHNIVASVKSIEAYDYNKRISVSNTPNEIRELVDTFNELLSRHKESFNKISQFSSDASHELKTPLTVIRGEIEVGLRRVRSQAEYQKIMQDTLSEIIKIQHLIDGLLFLAKSDKLKIQKNFNEVYLDEIITESIDELKNLAQSKSIQIKIQSLEPLTVKGNETLLKIAYLNLLKNAIDYSHENSEIEIYIKNNNSGYVIGIKDKGIGIKPKDLEHIFDRFYRANRARTRSSGGTGLGLSIVKMILDIHEFDITYKSKANNGTLVEIFIKKYQNFKKN